MAAVWRSDLELHEKAVLSAILTFCETSRADLTVDEPLASIAARAKVSERIARYTVADLVNDGSLTREGSTGTRPRLTVIEARVVALGDGAVPAARLPRKKEHDPGTACRTTPACGAGVVAGNPGTTCRTPRHGMPDTPAPRATAHIGTRALRPSSDPSPTPVPNGTECVSGDGVDEVIGAEPEREPEAVNPEQPELIPGDAAPEPKPAAPKRGKKAVQMAADVETVWNYWLDTLNLANEAHFATRSTDAAKARVGAVNARLRGGYTVEQIKRAVDGCAASEWHVAEGQVDLATICRPTKIDAFIGRAAARDRPIAAIPVGPVVSHGRRDRGSAFTGSGIRARNDAFEDNWGEPQPLPPLKDGTDGRR